MRCDAVWCGVVYGVVRGAHKCDVLQILDTDNHNSHNNNHKTKPVDASVLSSPHHSLSCLFVHTAGHAEAAGGCCVRGRAGGRVGGALILENCDVLSVVVLIKVIITAAAPVSAITTIPRHPYAHKSIDQAMNVQDILLSFVWLIF